MRLGFKFVRHAHRLVRSRTRLAVLVTFGAGVLIRSAFVALYRPGFLGISDSGSYIDAAHRGLFSNVYDPAGYPLFIRVLHALSAHLSGLILVQHALGVASAALLYLIIRRLTGSGLLGLIPAAVVLLDGFGIWVEHSPLSDTLFTIVVLLALFLALRGTTGSRWRWVAIGALIAICGLVRPVGLILLPVFIVWMLWSRRESGWARWGTVAALVGPGIVLLAGYVALQRANTGFLGLTQDSGRVLYARVAVFARCSEFTPPPGTAALCQTTPPGRRPSPNQYLTGFPDHGSGLSPAGRSISPAWGRFGPPPGGNGQLTDFALAAVVHQPLDYLARVADDFHDYWADDHRRFIAAAAEINPGVENVVASYYPTSAGATSVGSGFLRWYGETIQISGLLLIALLVASLAGPLAPDPRIRKAAILLATTGWLLPLAADATATVDPRYFLPAYGPLAASAALGLRAAPGRLRRAGSRRR